MTDVRDALMNAPTVEWTFPPEVARTLRPGGCCMLRYEGLRFVTTIISIDGVRVRLYVPPEAKEGDNANPR